MWRYRGFTFCSVAFSETVPSPQTELMPLRDGVASFPIVRRRLALTHLPLSLSRRLQHRARPEIASLISSIYPSLLNDEATTQLGGVRGIEKPLFFLKHSKKDSLESESGSRANVHEAKFIAALAGYLVRLSYTPSQITVLVPYCGQQLLLRRELKESGHPDVAVSLIDEFHGEANDIVLLSLVRSSEAQVRRWVIDVAKTCRASPLVVSLWPRLPLQPRRTVMRTPLTCAVAGHRHARRRKSRLQRPLPREAGPLHRRQRRGQHHKSRPPAPCSSPTRVAPSRPILQPRS